MLNDLKTSLRPAIVLTILFALLLGLLYPLALTGIGQAIFPHQAGGSLITDPKGQVIGSELIGQGFAADDYFHGRPSVAGTNGYDATASSGSNLGPASKALSDRVAGDVAKLHKTSTDRIPADLVTTSASGLDPDISPEAALYQAGRIASARHAEEAQVRELIDDQTRHPLLGFLGEDRVNVLMLNRALDQRFPRR